MQRYISNEEVRQLKKLNPCLQFADDEDGATDRSRQSARNKTTTDALRDDMIQLSSGNRNQNTLKVPETGHNQHRNATDLENGGGSSSHQGRWTQEEHNKFIKGKLSIDLKY